MQKGKEITKEKLPVAEQKEIIIPPVIIEKPGIKTVDIAGEILKQEAVRAIPDEKLAVLRTKIAAPKNTSAAT